MLGALRRKKNSPIITLLLGLTALLMIGFGVSFQGLSSAGVVAHVNGEPINELDFNSRYVVTFRNKQQQDRRYDRTRAEKEGLREQVLNSMMTSKILSQKGADLGLAVDDQALRSAITDDPQFQDDQGRFDKTLYQRTLSYLRTTDRRFERQYRDEILARPLTSILQTVGPSEAEVRARFLRDENKVNVAFVQFPKAEYADEVGEVTPADVDEWRSETEDPEAAIMAYYKANKRKKYDLPKRVCAQHVLIKTVKEAPPDVRKEQRSRIEAVLTSVQAGEDFSELARKFSEDSSASKGGDLGCFGPGQMVGPFEEAAFGLEPGETSGVVTTNFGYHIIKVNEIKPAVQKKLEEVKDEIAMALTREAKAQRVAKNEAEAFLKVARDEPDLAAAVEAFESQNGPRAAQNGPDRGAGDSEPDLTVEESGLITASRTFVPKLGSAKEVIATAWKLTEDAPLADAPIETDRAWVVIRLKERVEADESTYDEKKKFIVYQLTMEKRERLLEAWFKDLRAKADTSFDPIAIRYDDEAQNIRQARRRM